MLTMNKKRLTQISGIIIGIERQQRVKTDSSFSVQNIIKADASSILPPTQKNLCSNKTIKKVEQGIYLNNELLYQNLARKIQRTFEYNESYNLRIKNVCNGLLLHQKYSSYSLLNQLSYLAHTESLYYKEMYELLYLCILFLKEKKDIDIQSFFTIEKYYHLLPITLQFILGYTLSLYYFHYKSNLSTFQKFLEHFSSLNIKDPTIKKLIHQLTIYHHLILRNFVPILVELKNNPSSPYFSLTSLYLDIVNIEYWIEETEALIHTFDDYLKGMIYSDIAFMYLLNHNYEKAYLFFQKSIHISPMIVYKYALAYYETIIHTQPSSHRFIQYYHQLHHPIFLTHFLDDKSNTNKYLRHLMAHHSFFKNNPIPLLKSFNYHFVHKKSPK